jgi:hypothetical protein
MLDLMKTAGEILSALFDEQFIKKAQKFSKFFDSWKDITAKNGIAAAADHSRIKDLDRGLLLIEMDHPGWKQILQTKQSKLLNDFRIRFPELDISGISLILGKSEPDNDSQGSVQDTDSHYADQHNTTQEYAEEPSAPDATEKKDINSINDDDFKETLRRIGQNITAREKKA